VCQVLSTEDIPCKSQQYYRQPEPEKLVDTKAIADWFGNDSDDTLEQSLVRWF
jgi:hypothetical protein